ncbi:MAG: nucleotidyltransferase [Candidatus Altiarchaeales archaeon A3]|nr:MAG: nucleotidyltransferase [Candidatus Altiarchaeales archaeon A3]
METKTYREIEEKLKKHKQLLNEKFKVKNIGIFGSYARGEESKDSDVDVMVEFYGPVGWEFIDLKEFLEGLIKKDIDLVTIMALKPRLKDNILKEVVYV